MIIKVKRISNSDVTQPLVLISQMLFIHPLTESHSGQSISYPHIFLRELGEQPGVQREVTAGQMEVREIVGWDRDQQIM